MGRILKWSAFIGLAIALLVASGLVDVRVSMRDQVAGAIDLFGDKAKEQAPAAQAEPFWSEGGTSRPAEPPRPARRRIRTTISKIAALVTRHLRERCR